MGAGGALTITLMVRSIFCDSSVSLQRRTRCCGALVAMKGERGLSQRTMADLDSTFLYYSRIIVWMTASTHLSRAVDSYPFHQLMSLNRIGVIHGLHICPLLEHEDAVNVRQTSYLQYISLSQFLSFYSCILINPFFTH